MSESPQVMGGNYELTTGAWLLVGAFLLATFVYDMLPTKHSVVMAVFRACIGLSFLGVMMLDILPTLTGFLGKGFLFLALYGLAAPMESTVTTGVADLLVKK